MTRPRQTAFIGIFWVLAAAGCTQPLLPQTGAPLQAGETASIAVKPSDAGPGDTSLMVSGEPTEVYSIVARGALNCWFGGEGPLKRSHIFQAEAAPPTRGGAAEIVLQERDQALPDQRGVRAFRVSFTPGAGGTLVVIATSKIAPQLAEAMIRDVEVWARGGQGCQLRVVAPPPPSPAPAPKLVKGKSTR